MGAIGDAGADTVEERAVKVAKRIALKEAWFGAIYSAIDLPTQQLVQRLPIVDKRDAMQVLDGLQTHLVGTVNDRVRRKAMMARVRKPNESGEDFLAAVRALGAKCKWVVPASAEEMLEEEIARCVIMGVNDQPLQEKLLALPKATNAEICTLMCQTLSAKADSKTIENIDGGKAETHALQQSVGGIKQKQWQQRKQQWQQQQLKGDNSGSCRGCGQKAHTEGRACPAKHVKCFQCNKMGHFADMCQSSAQEQANTAKSDSEGEESETLGRLEVMGVNKKGREKLIKEEVNVTLMSGRKIIIPFLADTGANITCLPYHMIKALGIRESDISERAEPPQAPVQANGRKSYLWGVGFVYGKARVANSTEQKRIRMAVFKGLQRPILSREASAGLGIWTYTGEREEERKPQARDRRPDRRPVSEKLHVNMIDERCKLSQWWQVNKKLAGERERKLQAREENLQVRERKLARERRLAREEELAREKLARERERKLQARDRRPDRRPVSEKLQVNMIDERCKLSQWWRVNKKLVKFAM